MSNSAPNGTPRSMTNIKNDGVDNLLPPVNVPPVSGAGGIGNDYFESTVGSSSVRNDYFESTVGSSSVTEQQNTVLPSIEVVHEQKDNIEIGMNSTLSSAPTGQPIDNADRTIPVANINGFTLGTTLGTGSFGRVRFATERATGEIYAVKILKKTAVVKLQQITHILDEKKILTRISHPFIVNLKKKFQDTKYLYLYLEYIIGGEFFSWLRREGRFSNDHTKFYAAQITSIFEYLHTLDIVYRDLKPENILIDRQGYLKLTDFGFAKEVRLKTYTLCGTPEYIAPEVLLNKGHGKGVDWWTLGILIFETLCGQPPFNDDDPMGIYQQIIQGRIVFPRVVEKDAKSLIKHLLVQDLTKRYGCMVRGAQDVKDHRWFNGLDWDALYNYQLPAPFIPPTENENSTQNFDKYPDSTEEVQDPVYPGEDPFLEF